MEHSRFRINAKQTAKNYWQIEGTVELPTDIIRVTSKTDAADITELKIGDKLLEIVKSAEKAFIDDGRKLVGDD